MKWKLLALLAVCAAVPAQANAQNRGNEGLTKIELLALQQEMRDRGCGNRHAPGVWTAETRRAVRTCSQRLGVTGGARALLVAFNVGFSANDNPPPGRGDRAGVVGELGTHPARAGQTNRAAPARRATPATPATPARAGAPATPATRATPATPATPARPATRRRAEPRDTVPTAPSSGPGKGVVAPTDQNPARTKAEEKGREGRRRIP